MKLRPLTSEQCEQVRIWRNEEMYVWRTPFMLTEEMQHDFYINRVCNRESNHRYWAIIGEPTDEINTSMTPENPVIKTLGHEFIGMGGITGIQWENRIGEITLIINPADRKHGLGERATDLILDQAFNHLNLQTVFGECYWCNQAFDFWKKIAKRYSGYITKLPNRKYWKGNYFDSWYFSMDKDDFNGLTSGGEAHS